MSKINKITKGISFDKELIEVASELLPNRSEPANEGLLKAVIAKLESLKPSIKDEYMKRIEHLID